MHVINKKMQNLN